MSVLKVISLEKPSPTPIQSPTPLHSELFPYSAVIEHYDM